MRKTLALASECCPRHLSRHLYCYLKGVADAIAKDAGLQSPAGAIDLDSVLEHGHDLRIEYANGRLQSADLGKFERALMDAVAAVATIDAGNTLRNELLSVPNPVISDVYGEPQGSGEDACRYAS